MPPFQLTRFKAFTLIMLFSLLAVACVGGYESDAGSRDATSERSSRLSSSRTSARDSSDHGAAAAPSPGSAPSTSDAHGAPSASDAHGAPSTSDAHGAPAAVHWEYDGDLGPIHWGDLADKFIACKTGTSQSPINISNVINPHPAQIEFNYNSVPLRILNNGHTIQPGFPRSNHLSWI
jgi:hypothetical protein